MIHKMRTLRHYTLLFVLIPLLLTYGQRLQANDCETETFSSPIWINEGLIAVAGCMGIQIYNSDLEAESLIELMDVRYISSSNNSEWLLAYANNEINLIRLDNFEIVASFQGTQFAWHHTEERFVFASNLTNPNSIAIYDVNEEKVEYQQTIEHLVSRLLWSSNDYIQYIGIGNFEVYQWYIGEPPQIIFENTALIEWGIFERGIWSPDSTSFIFVSRPNYGGQEAIPAYLGIQNVVTETTYQVTPITQENFHLSTTMDVSWHPDGELIAITSLDMVNILDSFSLEIMQAIQIYSGQTSSYLEFRDCSELPSANIIADIIWSPDGNRLLISGYCGIEIIPINLEMLQIPQNR